MTTHPVTRSTPRCSHSNPLFASLVAVILGSCGIPTDSTPRTFPAGANTTISSNQEIEVSNESESSAIFYQLGATDSIVPLGRKLEQPQNLNTLIEAALSNPSDAERAAGVGSRIPSGTTLLGEPRSLDSDRLLTIDLSADFRRAEGQTRRIAVAQLVVTVSLQLPRVRRVSIYVEGEPIQVATPRGDQYEFGFCDFFDLIGTPAEGSPSTIPNSADKAWTAARERGADDCQSS